MFAADFYNIIVVNYTPFIFKHTLVVRRADNTSANRDRIVDSVCLPERCCLIIIVQVCWWTFVGAMCYLIKCNKKTTLIHETSLTPSLFIHTPGPSQESELSSICVLRGSMLTLCTVLIFWFWNCSYFSFLILWITYYGVDVSMHVRKMPLYLRGKRLKINQYLFRSPWIHQWTHIVCTTYLIYARKLICYYRLLNNKSINALLTLIEIKYNNSI